MKVIWLRNFSDVYGENVFVLVKVKDYYLAQLPYLEDNGEIKSMQHHISESNLQEQLRLGYWILVKELSA